MGEMLLVEEDGAVTQLLFDAKKSSESSCGRASEAANDSERAAFQLLEEAEKELMEYFSGNRQEFQVPLRPKGTEFQCRVWNALREIPYGKTATYGEIAARIGSPRASRAVGGANHENPLPIFIPCHRVIGADGKLVGYSDGLPRKEFLLALESRFLLLSEEKEGEPEM